jgi:hypothetical protein
MRPDPNVSEGEGGADVHEFRVGRVDGGCHFSRLATSVGWQSLSSRKKLYIVFYGE